MAMASDVFTEIEQRASALIRKAEKPLSKSEAYSQIFQADPRLYERYRSATPIDVGNQLVLTKADGTTAPTFGSALMARQLDSLYDLSGALMSTLAGIVSSEAGDKGALVQQALDAFTTAVRGAFAQAGITVPAAKQALIPPTLEKELLYTLLKLAPADPLGRGGVVLAKALRQLRQGLAA
jgi:hypothetical protein